MLLEQRQAISRAEDPDPLVHEALERAIAGIPERRRRTGPLVALAAGRRGGRGRGGADLPTRARADAVAVRARRHPGRSGCSRTGVRRPAGAGARLRAGGAGARLGPAGRPAGRLGRHGDRAYRGAVGLDLRRVLPLPLGGLAVRGLRVGRPATGVRRHRHRRPGRLVPARLDRLAAGDRENWASLTREVAEAARSAAPTENGMPRLTVRTGMAPVTTCGDPHTGGAQERSVLRIEIDARDLSSCGYSAE